MNTLEKILKQDLKVAQEREKLNELVNQYTEEVRKFKNGSYVVFGKKIGKIKKADFRQSHDFTGIEYTVNVVTKNGELSISDSSYYYVKERDLSVHPVLNAINNK